MPQITAIKETKKGRLALFLDGEFAFSLDEETFAAADLHVEDELDAWQLEELRRKSDTRKADHAAGELYQKLCRKFDPHSAAAAVAKAEELGLLNDESYACRRAAELLRKRKSRREIAADLNTKGIDRDTAAAVLDELLAAPEDGEGDSPELAAAVAEGKRPQVMAALARRGFPHGVIREAVDRFAGEADAGES